MVTKGQNLVNVVEECPLIPDVQITPTQLGNVKDTERNGIRKDIEQKIVKKI